MNDTLAGVTATQAGKASDADLLDGLNGTAFALATHNHDAAYVNVSGDTMAGTLNLPANGLAAGTTQLVLSGGNVGVGTAVPGQKLTVAGNVRIEGANNGVTFPDGTTQTTAGVAPAAAVVNAQQVALLRWYSANQTGINFAVGTGPYGVAFDGPTFG